MAVEEEEDVVVVVVDGVAWVVGGLREGVM